MSTIAFDIEVAGVPWESVDESTRAYLQKRARSPEDRERVSERLGLYPGMGQIIAIGMWNLDAERGLILLDGETQEQQAWGRVSDSDIYQGSEAELLTRFWEIVDRKRPRLVSFNGRGYDGPVLTIRSAQLGVRPSLNLMPPRWKLEQHVDLMDVLSFQGAWRERYSLDYWCRRFGVESPKGSIDGSQVGQAYGDGKIEEIGEYCLRDVRATAELFQRIQHTLLPLQDNS